MKHVQGHCPACGREALGLSAGGHLVCCHLECPRPTAVDELLEHRDTDHVVQLDVDGFTLRHPLVERLDDALMTCLLHEAIAEGDGPPAPPGRYRVHVDEFADMFFLPTTTEGTPS